MLMLLDLPLIVASFALPAFGMSLSVIFVHIYIVEPGRDICICKHSVYTHIFMPFEMRLNVPIFLYVYICIMSVCIFERLLFIHLLGMFTYIYVFTRAHTQTHMTTCSHTNTHTHSHVQHTPWHMCDILSVL